MASDNTWLKDCRGKVIKIVAPVVPYLPQEERYRVVFMQRDIKEIVSSQNRMLGPVSYTHLTLPTTPYV